ncbi:MAG: hypothetical protein PHD61_00780 [Bacteroidales bacterium]|nr:hypothetical protein [Lentimicrobiaceae bacterium]MDD5693828.1 hypothetical protein [Bacteroidales bacterium]
MIRKKICLPAVVTLLAITFLLAGCSTSEKYYANKSKKYKKLKRKYEKYDCGCYAFPMTNGNDPVNSCAYPRF